MLVVLNLTLGNWKSKIQCPLLESFHKSCQAISSVQRSCDGQISSIEIWSVFHLTCTIIAKLNNLNLILNFHNTLVSYDIFSVYLHCKKNGCMLTVPKLRCSKQHPNCLSVRHKLNIVSLLKQHLKNQNSIYSFFSVSFFLQSRLIFHVQNLYQQ